MSWTVLVIEDDPEISMLLASVLGARGLRVITATHGADAIEQCRRSAIRPSVIVLDLMMPVMDGMAFLNEQPKIELLADVPVVLVSAVAPPAETLPPVVRAVMPKPMRLAPLIAAIQDACGQLRPIKGTTLEVPVIAVPTSVAMAVSTAGDDPRDDG